ncbi:hypothetical protein C5E45_25110 [Nocardia nova]|uniref:Uncharacterized protein n=1 Tax=Nocardia nova TaxID=37330 RepID=A0A2S6AK22_9NOCA|nr:hypothetical protein [Nocardia nova]PPJ24677.1 hypothetical protein C5E41_21885 [Nocardia nova]PPJ35574.1 hypothetical protein C5E45_25110 [Nocardia nova]
MSAVRLPGTVIARPRRRVTVTRLAGVAMAFDKLTPRAFGEFTARRMGVHRIFPDKVDRAARANYDRRVGNTPEG